MTNYTLERLIMLSILTKELKNFIIESNKEKDIEIELNNEIKKTSIVKDLKKKNKINDEFINKLENLTLEQLIILKLELVSQKYNIVIPNWFISKLEYIIKFILVKYSISKFNTIEEILIYLNINTLENFDTVLKELNYLNLGDLNDT